MSSCCSVKLRIFFAALGLVIGLSIFFCFGFVYDNWHTAVWGLLSGIFAGVTLGLHIWYQKDKVDEFRLWAHNMKPIMILGCLVQLAGVCGIVAYLTIAIFEHQDLVPEGRGFYLTTIWCFMTWKWGFLLFLSARHYRNEFRVRYHTNPDVKYEQLG